MTRSLSPLPRPPLPAGRVLDARLHLLDRQILDADGVPCGTVDDLEVESRDTDTDTDTGRAPAVVSAILTGPVLATRVLGGRQPSSRRFRIPWHAVAALGSAVSVSVRGDALEATWSERWLRDHVVARLPGGRRVPR